MLEDFDVIFNSISDSIVVLDLNNEILEANNATLTACNLSHKDVIGKKCYEIFHCSDHPPADCPNKKLQKSHAPETDDMVIEALNATFMVTVAPIFNTQGKMIKSVHIAHDITDRKKSEIERERLIAELSRRSNELEQLLYVTSHDLRSPLVNVDGYSKELEYSLKELMSSIENMHDPSSIKEKITPIVKEDIPESLHYIQISVSKMETLIKGILTLSRLGRSDLMMAEIDMNEMMSDIVDNHRFRLNELRIKTEVSKLPNCNGDSSQINQVFSNLLDNAIKYSDSERSSVINISGYKDKNQSVYCIDDNGLGIAAEHQDKIFDIFHQLEPGRIKGEGMGLTIANRIMEKHNGKIWVESELGKGSKFFVSLPS